MSTGEWADIRGDPRYEHLLAADESPQLSPADMQQTQQAMVVEDYGVDPALPPTAEGHAAVLFTNTGIIINRAGGQDLLPYNEPPPVRPGDRKPSALNPTNPLWAARAVFTRSVLSAPDEVFSYDQLYSVVLRREVGKTALYTLRRGIRHWWEERLVNDGISLVIGNKRSANGEHCIQANAALSVSVGTTLGWDLQYGTVRQRITPQ